MNACRRLLLSVPLIFPWTLSMAQTPADIGVVVMHGKGGNPDGLTAPLAAGLKQRGYWIANLEMPWSKRRSYDVDVATADKEVAAAIAAMRKKRGQKESLSPDIVRARFTRCISPARIRSTDWSSSPPVAMWQHRFIRAR
jgi:hypothetical protein